MRALRAVRGKVDIFIVAEARIVGEQKREYVARENLRVLRVLQTDFIMG